jgi:acetyl-CoA C-acetyltransferase
MRDAVPVPIAGTPIGKADRQAFNATPPPTLSAHAIRAVVERASAAPAELRGIPGKFLNVNGGAISIGHAY